MKLTFDDVLIKPRYSEVDSRADIEFENRFIVSANMADITGTDLCRAMYEAGELGCLHRFWSIDANVLAYSKLRQEEVDCWVSVGFEHERFEALASVDSFATIVVDVAHGNTAKMREFLRWANKTYPLTTVVMGNVVEWPDFKLPENVRGIKVGIGPGSRCTTRVVTGCGYPQLSAIQKVYKVRDKLKPDVDIIADGGLNSSGDIAKALAAGADMVMTGSLVAYTSACENKERYAGSASLESYQATGKTASHRAPEGVAKYSSGQPLRDTVEVVNELKAGVRSALSYVGARTLSEFRKRAEFVRVSPSVVRENHSR